MIASPIIATFDAELALLHHRAMCHGGLAWRAQFERFRSHPHNLEVLNTILTVLRFEERLFDVKEPDQLRFFVDNARMVLFIIGLGLADENDITLKGLQAIKSCEHVYLESYTSILMVPDYQERLEKLYGKPITVATREIVELQADDLLIEQSRTSNVAFLVVGDPLSATTHTDLILRARAQKIPVKIIHNASIMTAIGSSGLQGYNFGQTVSIPFWTAEWKPDSWLERIGENLRIGCHTLCLGDIKVREQSQEDMAR
jgi:diphthine methyl ester synthase